MRLWPYQMLDVLPYRYLLSQWRECLAIGGIIKTNGGLNHSTINRIEDYPIEHFFAYCDLVRIEFARRELKIGENTLEKLKEDVGYHCTDLSNVPSINSDFETESYAIYGYQTYPREINYNKIIELKDGSTSILFENYHNDRRIKQCYYKFQEFYDTDAISEEVWDKIYNKFKYLGFEK